MNFVGKFDAKLPVEGPVAHPVAFAHVDGASTHAPSDAIIVPDAQLLFGGDFKRSGVDLVLSKDDHEVVLHDYFKGEKRAALASPDGAHLTGDLVNALTGHVEYAQADGAVAAAVVVVGHVTKLTGSATAIRNGVSIILNQGDNIDKGDVLQSGADSTLGVTFIDGTVFGMSSNARMVVNEMVYDPNGSNNSSLLSLVAGTISFVAGETAKHGDMKVDTPVATMGIRGTAVLVEIDFAVPGQNGAPSANFQVLVEPDGTTGSYILFDKNTLAPLATVNTAGTLTKISQGVVSFQAGSPLTPDEQKLINDLFTTKFGDNNNTKNTNHVFTDTPVPQSLAPIKLADGTTATPLILIVTNPGSSSSSAPSSATAGVPHIAGAPTVVTFNNAFTEHTLITGSTALDTQTAQIRFADLNAGDLPTVKVEFSSFTYQDAHQNDIAKALSPTEQTAIKAVEAISLQQDPGNNNNGSATWTYSFPDKAFDFLGAGETLTLTYTALVNNNFLPSPEIGTQQFTITIVGTNDVPVITSSIPQTIAFVGGTSVPGGDLAAHVPTSGTISFDDPDLTDTHTVSVKLLLDGLDLPPTPLQIFKNALTASIATDSTGTGFGTVNWKLAELPVYLADFIPKGETITLTYEVTVTDSQGTSSKQDITVTITGTDTPAVVWIATASGSSSGGLWSDASNWETGTAPTANDDAIIITDQLIGLTPSYPVTITEAAEAKSLEMDNFGTSAPLLINQSTLTIGGAFSMSDHAPPDSDSTTKHTPPELDNQGTLTIGGAFDMSADSIVHNSGTISVGGLMEVQDTSVLENSGALILQQGGDFKDQSTITNIDTGSIEISGGTLNVQVDIANAGQVTIDSNATLELNGAAIDGGVVTDHGTLDLAGQAVLKNGTLVASGQINVDSFGNAWDNESVTISGVLTIAPSGTLTIDQGSNVTNTGIISVVGGALEIGELTVNDATIDGGSIINAGAINLAGAAVLENGSLQNGNYILVSGLDNAFHHEVVTVGGVLEILPGGALTIDQASKITNPHSLEVDAGTLTLNDATIDTGVVYNDAGGTIDFTGSAVVENGWLYNFGQFNVSGTGNALHNVDLPANVALEVLAGGALTIDQGTDIANSGGTVTVDDAATLTLNDVTVTSGAVTNTTNGTIDFTGTAVLKNGALGNSGQINVSGAGNALDDVGVTNHKSIEVFAGSALTLDDGTSVTNTDGTITIDGNGTLTLNDASISGGIIDDFSALPSGSMIAGDIDVTGSSTISNAQLNNGRVTIGSNTTLTLSGDTVSGTSFIDTASGATILIDGASTLDGVAITGGSVSNTDATLTVDVDQTLTLQGGATVVGGTVDNSGTVAIESASGATLDGVAVTGAGTIQVDGSVPTTSTPLVLADGTTITDGKLKVGPVGVVSVKTAKGVTLNDVAVTNDNSIEVFAASVLALASGTIIDNSSGIITVDGTGALTLSQATIDGGTINDYSTPPSGSMIAGDIDVTGSSTISNAHLNNGHVTIGNNATLTLDGTTVTGSTFTDTADGAVIQIDGGTTLTLDHATINGGAINDFSTPPSGSVIAGDIDVTGASTISNAHLNNGRVTIAANQTLTLDNDTITGTHFADTASGAVIQIDGGTTLKLDHATIDGGTINDFSTPPSGSTIAGDIDVIGSSTISNAHLNNGQVTIAANQTLTLDGTTVTGTTFTDTADGAIIQIDGGTTLTLDHATINGGTINDFSTPPSGSVIAGDIDVTGSSTISNAHLNNGQVTIGANQTLTLDGTTVTGTTFADTADVAIIQIDGGTTLTLDHATIDGGAINDFSTLPSGSVIAGDIDVTGSSTISHAQLNYGNVTIQSGLSLTLDGDTVTGTAFTGIATGSIIHVDGGDTLTLNSATVSGGGVTIGADALVKTGGDVTLTNTSVTNDGTIEITGGTLKITGSVASSGPDANGSIKIDSGAALDLDGSDTQNVVFAGTNGELQIDTSSFGGSISGLAATDEIDLSTIGYGPGTTGTYSGGVLTITDGTHSISMTLSGDYSDAHFAGSSDGHGGTLITLNANDDAPVFDSADTTQIAKVTELADTTGSTSSDSSSPASGTIHFTDIDLTDRPTATITQSVTWASGTTDLSSSLTPTEISAFEHAFSLTQSGNTNNGAIGWSYQISDGALDFLGAGEKATVTSTILLDDHQNGHDTATVTVTINGANDAPVLAADTSGAAGTNQHAIAELAGQTGDIVDHDSASGTLSFTDADLTDTHTVSHSGPAYVLSGGTLDTTQIDALTAAGQLTLSEIDSTHSGTGSVGFSYSAADSSFDFLAEGQTLTVTYSITVTDNSNVSSSQPVTFTITGSNDAPVVDAHNSTLSYTENQAPAAIDAAVTPSDVDSATLGSATVQISGNFVAGEDVLGFVDQNGIHGSYDAVHGILTLTGTSSVANYQAALASVTYFDSSDNPSAAPRTISFSVDDGASANSHSNITTATVDVTPVNDAPVVTFVASKGNAISVPENTATHLTGISVSDVDAGTGVITVTLALPDASSGSLSAHNFDGVAIGGNAIALTITGSLAEINTFLADTRHGVTYTPAAGLIHDVTLTATANDHGATGSGGALDSAPQPVLLDLVPDGLPASHANLIVNGGFETGDFSGWKLGNGAGHAIGINFLVGSEHSENHGSGDMAHHGLKEALFGGIGGDVTLSQSVATNANEHYTVDFWVMNDTSASPGEHGFGGNDFSASWNGVALMPTIVNADKSSGYTEYQFDVTGAAGHSTLEFSARNDDGYWNLDDVSVREGAPDRVNQLTDETTSVSGVHVGDALTVTAADSNSLGMVTAAAGTGTVEWQFAASNAQLDHLMGLTQTYTVSDASNPAITQTIAVSIGGLGHDQFVFNPGVGADTMVNFSTVSNSQGSYVGDTIELDKFSNIHSISDVLHNLSTDAHGNAVVDLGNHDSITFQGINAATIQANAMHMFVLHSTSGNMA